MAKIKKVKEKKVKEIDDKRFKEVINSGNRKKEEEQEIKDEFEQERFSGSSGERVAPVLVSGNQVQETNLERVAETAPSARAQTAENNEIYAAGTNSNYSNQNYGARQEEFIVPERTSAPIRPALDFLELRRMQNTWQNPERQQGDFADRNVPVGERYQPREEKDERRTQIDKRRRMI
jgi:hypothetical protein